MLSDFSVASHKEVKLNSKRAFVVFISTKASNFLPLFINIMGRTSTKCYGEQIACPIPVLLMDSISHSGNEDSKM